jgi:hypothetical protein
MNIPFEFTHRFTLAELKRYLLVAHKRRMLFLRLCGIILCVALLFSIVMLLFSVDWDVSFLAFLLTDTELALPTFVLLFLLPLCIAFPKYAIWYPGLWLGGRQYRQGITRFVFGDDALCIHFSMLSDTPVTIPYTKIRRLLEADDALFIPYWRGDAYVMLPKSEFTEESLTSFCAFIEEKTGKQIKIIQ